MKKIILACCAIIMGSMLFSLNTDLSSLSEKAVSPLTGDLDFGIDILSVQGRNSMSMNVGVSYSSNSVFEATEMNAATGSGILGVGWKMDFERIERDHRFTASTEDDVFYYFDGSSYNELVEKDNTGLDYRKFATKKLSTLLVKYYEAANKWEIVLPNSNVKTFGKLTPQTTDGVKYTVHFGDKFSKLEEVHVTGITEMPTEWHVKELRHLSGDTVTFDYLNIMEKPVRVQNSSTPAYDAEYTIETYLTKITDSFGRRVIFTYNDKDYREYWFNPFDLSGNNPSKFNNQFKRKYLSQIEVYNSPEFDSRPIKGYDFEYKPLVGLYSQLHFVKPENNPEIISHIRPNTDTYIFDWFLKKSSYKRYLEKISEKSYDNSESKAKNLTKKFVKFETNNKGQITSISNEMLQKVDFEYEKLNITSAAVGKTLKLISPYENQGRVKTWVYPNYTIVAWDKSLPDSNKTTIQTYVYDGIWKEVHSFEMDTKSLNIGGVVGNVENGRSYNVAGTNGDAMPFDIYMNTDYFVIHSNYAGFNKKLQIVYKKDDTNLKWEKQELDIPFASSFNKLEDHYIKLAEKKFIFGDKDLNKVCVANFNNTWQINEIVLEDEMLGSHELTSYFLQADFLGKNILVSRFCYDHYSTEYANIDLNYHTYLLDENRTLLSSNTKQVFQSCVADAFDIHKNVSLLTVIDDIAFCVLNKSILLYTRFENNALETQKRKASDYEGGNTTMVGSFADSYFVYLDKIGHTYHSPLEFKSIKKEDLWNQNIDMHSKGSSYQSGYAMANIFKGEEHFSFRAYDAIAEIRKNLIGGHSDSGNCTMSELEYQTIEEHLCPECESSFKYTLIEKVKDGYYRVKKNCDCNSFYVYVKCTCDSSIIQTQKNLERFNRFSKWKLGYNMDCKLELMMNQFSFNNRIFENYRPGKLGPILKKESSELSHLTVNYPAVFFHGRDQIMMGDFPYWNYFEFKIANNPAFDTSTRVYATNDFVMYPMLEENQNNQSYYKIVRFMQYSPKYKYKLAFNANNVILENSFGHNLIFSEFNEATNKKELTLFNPGFYRVAHDLLSNDLSQTYDYAITKVKLNDGINEHITKFEYDTTTATIKLGSETAYYKNSKKVVLTNYENENTAVIDAEYGYTEYEFLNGYNYLTATTEAPVTDLSYTPYFGNWNKFFGKLIKSKAYKKNSNAHELVSSKNMEYCILNNDISNLEKTVAEKKVTVLKDNVKSYIEMNYNERGQLKKKITTDSIGETSAEELTYIDEVYSGLPENMIGYVVASSKFKNDLLITRELQTFKNWGNNLWKEDDTYILVNPTFSQAVPGSSFWQNHDNGNLFENYVRTQNITKYSEKGNLLEMVDENNNHVAKIMDSLDMMPIATVVNSKQNEAFYKDFELSNQAFEEQSLTGKRSKLINSQNYSLDFSQYNFELYKEYKLEFWAKSIGSNTNVDIAYSGLVRSSTGNATYECSNQWQLFTDIVKVSSADPSLSFSSNSNVCIDNIRFYPADAKMQNTTFDYWNLDKAEATNSANSLAIQKSYDLFDSSVSYVPKTDKIEFSQSFLPKVIEAGMSSTYVPAKQFSFSSNFGGKFDFDTSATAFSELTDQQDFAIIASFDWNTSLDNQNLVIDLGPFRKEITNAELTNNSIIDEERLAKTTTLYVVNYQSKLHFYLNGNLVASENQELPLNSNHFAINITNLTSNSNEIFELNNLTYIRKPLINVGFFNGIGQKIQNQVLYPEGGGLLQGFKYQKGTKIATEQFLPCYSDEVIGQYIEDFESSLVHYYQNTDYIDTEDAFNHVLSTLEDRYLLKGIELEKSPLLRIAEQGGVGRTFTLRHSGGKKDTIEYSSNAINEVRRWVKHTQQEIASILSAKNSDLNPSEVFDGYMANTTYYKPNTLSKTIYTNKQGHKTVKYTTLDGKPILIKKLLPDNTITNESCNYFVYDTKGNIRFIIPPEAYEEMKLANDFTLTNAIKQKWITEHVYDGLLKTKTSFPDRGDIEYVYNKLGKQVLEQNERLKQQNAWLFNKYDKFGNNVISGIYYADRKYSRTEMQAKLNTYNEVSGKLFEKAVPVSTFDYSYGYSNDTFPPIHSCKVNNVSFFDTYDVAGRNYKFYIYDGFYQETDSIKPLMKKTAEFIRVEENAVLGSGEYNSPIPGQDIYIKGESIRLKPGFSTAINNSVWAGKDIYTLHSPQWNKNFVYYDEDGRVIQTRSLTADDVSTITSIKYTEQENVSKKMVTHIKSNETTKVLERYTYDRLGRLKYHYQKLNEQPEKCIAEYNYSKIGQLVEKNIEPSLNNFAYTNSEVLPFASTIHSDRNASLQSYDYKYNLLGNLIDFNKGTTDLQGESDLFRYSIEYFDQINDGNTYDRFDGRIKKVEWYTARNGTNGYRYSYDSLNRLKSATSINNNEAYSASYSYDLHGNITSLTRNGKYSENAYGKVDDLLYFYKGNKLDMVVEQASQTSGTDFNNPGHTAQPSDYIYDSAGSLIEDKNRGHKITYNEFYLPKIVDAGNGNYVVWKYDGKGNKIGKTVYENNAKVYEESYNSGFIYRTSYGPGATVTETMLNFTEGIVRKVQGNWQNEYHIKDHLGNVRMVYTKNESTNQPEIKQESHYYPYGLKIAGLCTSSGIDEYSLEGQKQLTDHNLNWVEYALRNYDPQLARWHSVDPYIEGFSSYVYCKADPANRVEINGGMSLWRRIKNPWMEFLPPRVFIEGVGMVQPSSGDEYISLRHERTREANRRFMVEQLEKKLNDPFAKNIARVFGNAWNKTLRQRINAINKRRKLDNIAGVGGNLSVLMAGAGMIASAVIDEVVANALVGDNIPAEEIKFYKMLISNMKFFSKPENSEEAFDIKQSGILTLLGFSNTNVATSFKEKYGSYVLGYKYGLFIGSIREFDDLIKMDRDSVYSHDTSFLLAQNLTAIWGAKTFVTYENLKITNSNYNIESSVEVSLFLRNPISNAFKKQLGAAIDIVGTYMGGTTNLTEFGFDLVGVTSFRDKFLGRSISVTSESGKNLGAGNAIYNLSHPIDEAFFYGFKRGFYDY